MTANQQQQNIIDEPNNCVVIAAPGSGKTFVVSQKVRNILAEAIPFKGVIAISYTNEASAELKHRSLRGGIQPKGSYFGTIDSFCFVEIIASFGKHVFGYPKSEFDIVQTHELQQNIQDKINGLPPISNYDDLEEAHLEVIRELYLSGKVILNLLAVVANYIFDNSKDCQLYLKARYTHVFIDEYQDSGNEQHLMFTKLIDLGIIGIAVGDVNQAIFTFAKKDSKYITSLTKDERFTTYPLLTNFRCHPSISNYAKRFIATFIEGFKPIYAETDDQRVHEKCVAGKEADICMWLDQAIPLYCDTYGVSDLAKVGIFVSGNKNGEDISKSLKTASRLIRSTELDNDVSLWSAIFKRTLKFVFDPDDTPLNVFEAFSDIHTNDRLTRRVVEAIRIVKTAFADLDDLSDLYEQKIDVDRIVDLFCTVADLIYSGRGNKKSKAILKNMLIEKTNLESYFPTNSNEVQVMTFYKSKGLEFDVIFHLDLYKYILPKEGKRPDKTWGLTSLAQCTNVHFVALTRAKEVCILVHSTKRTNWQDEVKEGIPSAFLTHSNLQALHDVRVPSPY